MAIKNIHSPLLSSPAGEDILAFIQQPLKIGERLFPSRLIQGPLAGFSCAPFRQLFYRFTPPAYAVSEMISAHDVMNKHTLQSRYLYRGADEKTLCYQLSGSKADLLADAASRLESLGADLIDLNCGCPKAKIRKKGAGSALLESPEQLAFIVESVKKRIRIPLTVKIRIRDEDDRHLARRIEEAGADALIVHGRRWIDDYDTPCDYTQIALIKLAVTIPVIANGDIADKESLQKAIELTGCDGYMISRAGSGHPWLYQQLLTKDKDAYEVTDAMRRDCFLAHIHGLAQLENEHSAVLQSKSLARYYFKHQWSDEQLQSFYAIEQLSQIELLLK